MLGIDTNLLVRFLTWDDPPQAERATEVLESQETFISTSALLETAWVLRSAHGYSTRAVVDGLGKLAGLPRVRLEHPERLALAIEWCLGGMDFADALHLAASEDCEAFVSFDANLAKTARAVGALDVRTP